MSGMIWQGWGIGLEVVKHVDKSGIDALLGYGDDGDVTLLTLPRNRLPEEFRVNKQV